MPGLEDPNFNHGVTLLCQHNDEGALGITVNRLSEFLLEDVFEQLDIACADPAIGAMPVYSGGPVHPERGFVLHSPDQQWDTTVAVGSDILVTTSREVLEAIASGQGPEKFLVALGYAGWGSGQLEDEMRDNAWLTVMASAEIVFDLPADVRWKRAVASLGIDIATLQPAGGHA